MVTSAEEEILSDDFYDEDDSTELYNIPVVLPNPTREERKDIRFLKTLYRSVMFVTGKERQGKDLFGVALTYKMKRYFNRPILLDFKPKRLYGKYTYFNPVIMMREIDKMAKLSGVREVDLQKPLNEKQEKAYEEASVEWLSLKENEVKFKNAVIYLSELRRYCHNRNPHNRINKFIGGLNTVWGHLDMLTIGTHTLEEEIDENSFLAKTRIWARCSWSINAMNTTDVKIRRGIYLSEQGMFDVGRDNIKNLPVYSVDGGKPREYLTRSDTRFTITPQGMIRARKDDILHYLDQYGTSEAKVIAGQLGANIQEALNALWILSINGCVIGNRFFDLWKSKNMVNLKPTLRQEA